MEASDRARFTALGLEGALKQLDQNSALVGALNAVVAASGLEKADKAVGNLLYSVATGIPEMRASRRAPIAAMIGKGELATAAQVTAAIDYVKKKPAEGEIDVEDFKRACGAGVSFSDDDIRGKAAAIVDGHRAAIEEQRFLFSVGTLMAGFRDGDWKWADGAKAKAAIDAAFAALVGPRVPEDDAREAAAKEAKAAAGKGAKGAAKEAAKGAAAPKDAPAGKGGKAADAAPAAGAGAAAGAPAAGEASVDATVFQARELKAAQNSPAHVAAHKARTGGILRTRFPPEPNGFLHIGHAKSMNLNFEGAFRALGVDPVTQGATIFRYDDTNPDAESAEYIASQADNVAWLGWKPLKVTHSSDHFEKLYELACEMIRRGKAYVCHQTRDEMEASRDIAKARAGGDPNSPWRERSVEENLREFAAMRAGKYEEGKAVLRLKADMASVNPTFWDPVAYRVKFTPHPMTGTAWCIYPSYDYSHCIIDSLEDIDYSLCTLEFEVRRDLYYWVLEMLDLYRPTVFEFSRLNVLRNVLSKRKIIKLVMDGKVHGWDDPRLLTINGLRRRGYTAEAINNFCRDIGVTRNENKVDMHRLEFHCREHLDVVSRRAFAVLHPLRVTLTDFAADRVETIEAADFPRDKALGMHRISLTRTVFIERDDFRDVDAPDFFGLAPGKTAGLRYAGYVRVTDVKRDAAGNAVELLCEYDHARGDRLTGGSKPKGNLHWVSGSAAGAEPAQAEVRLYDYLFTVEEPGVAGDWEADLNPASEVIVRGAMVDASLVGAAPMSHFQFERIGYFVTDPDSDAASGRLVFNMTVGLKEAADTKKVKGK